MTGAAARQRDVIFAAAMRTHAGVAGQRREREAILDAGVVAGRVHRSADGGLPLVSRLDVAQTCTRVAARPTISALELLIPDAGAGHSRSDIGLRTAPGKLRSSL